MKIHIIQNKLVITTKKKPVEGDLMLCFSRGITSKKTKITYGKGHFIKYHDNGIISKVDSICEDTRKIILMISF